MKPLQARSRYRLRIGSYRAVFDEDAVTLDVITGGERCPQLVGSSTGRFILPQSLAPTPATPYLPTA